MVGWGGGGRGVPVQPKFILTDTVFYSFQKIDFEISVGRSSSYRYSGILPKHIPIWSKWKTWELELSPALEKFNFSLKIFASCNPSNNSGIRYFLETVDNITE